MDTRIDFSIYIVQGPLDRVYKRSQIWLVLVMLFNEAYDELNVFQTLVLEELGQAYFV